MPIPTPFHSRTAPLCESHEWRNWSGYLAASLFDTTHEREYYAIRNAAALIDVSPLFKYEVTGPDAEKLLNRMVTRNLTKCRVGQVMYSPWCDDDGKVIDDGTISRLAADRFRITAAEPNYAWFQDCAIGLEVDVADISDELAALAVQGPNALRVVRELISERGSDRMALEGLRYYHILQTEAPGYPVAITRTGYTGDLGYELWVEPQYAGVVWDSLVEKGTVHGLAPAGMVALDIARIEAGYLLIGVDYIPSRQALIEIQKSSPLELGLGWAVDLSKDDFIGLKALKQEMGQGSKWAIAGLEVNWRALEELYGRIGLAPRVAGRASRQAVPVYASGRQIGQATSQTFSPVLKKYIAISSLERPYAEVGREVEIEVTVEYSRMRAKAEVVKYPFFNPPRKRAVEAG